MRNLAILGSTGSIGSSTLDVVKSNPGISPSDPQTAILVVSPNHSTPPPNSNSPESLVKNTPIKLP